MPHYPVASSLVRGRVDQGVDWGGAGYLFAVENGWIANVYNSGWPGGTFIVLMFDTVRDDRHRAVYYAEDITPFVSNGQHVNAGDTIGYAYGGGSGIEIGWASFAHIGQSLQADTVTYSGDGATPEGNDFAAWISGAPVPTFGPAPSSDNNTPNPQHPANIAWENLRHWVHEDWPSSLAGCNWVEYAIDQL